MEFRIRDLLNEFNNKMSLIIQYLDKNGIDIKMEVDVQRDYLPHPYELKNDPNKRREGSIARINNNIIYYSPLSSQMIWYIAWLAYLIKENHYDKLDKDDFISRLINVDKGENNELSCKNLIAWNSYELNSIFLYAMSFIICHELGHKVYNHPGYMDEKFEMRDPELLKENELQADTFAADCVTHISDKKESELAVYGLIVAQLALLFIRNKEVTYVTHPDPETRINNSLKDIEISDAMKNLIKYAKELSSLYVKKRFV